MLVQGHEGVMIGSIATNGGQLSRSRVAATGVRKKPVDLEKMTKDDLAWKTWDRRKPPDDPEPTAWSLQSEKTNRKAREARMVMQRLTWRHYVDTEAEAARSMRSRVTHG